MDEKGPPLTGFEDTSDYAKPSEADVARRQSVALNIVENPLKVQPLAILVQYLYQSRPADCSALTAQFP